MDVVVNGDSLNVTGRFGRGINQHRTHGRFERIANSKLLKAVMVHQFLTRFLGIASFRVTRNGTRGEQRLFDVLPATRA